MDPPAGHRIRFGAFEDELRRSRVPFNHHISQSIPVTIFHPILAEFKYDLVNLSVIEPTPRDVEGAMDFVMRSLEIYPEEDDRIEETRPLLQSLFGYGNWILIHGRSTTGKVCHYRDLALVAAVEWRNEFGSIASSDASVEVAGVYRRHVLQGSLQRVRNSSCCPSLLFALMGPYLRIQGAVLLDNVIYEAFTEYIWLGGDPYLDANVMRVARIFGAVAKAIRNLHMYYDNLELSDDPVPSRLFPRPTFQPENQPDFQLAFTEKLYPESKIPRLLFGAAIAETTHQPKKVIVKFAESYGEEAHRLLAEHDLAPRLHFCKRTRCGLLMIVMDRVEGQDAYILSPGEPPDYVKKDVDRAIQLLHQRGFVHGEICLSNILVVKRSRSQQKEAAATASTSTEAMEMNVDDTDSENLGAVLVDFEWSGKEGEAKYSPFWFNQPVPGGAGGLNLDRIGVIKKEHDRFMFKRLGHWRA